MKGHVIPQRAIKEEIISRSVKQMLEMDFSERESGTAMLREMGLLTNNGNPTHR